jgi:hypothetical protein
VLKQGISKTLSARVRRARAPPDALTAVVARRPRPALRPEMPQFARATRLPVAALYARRARGGPSVRPRYGRTCTGRGAM